MTTEEFINHPCAFPGKFPTSEGGTVFMTGLTMLDYFAALALNGMVVRTDLEKDNLEKTVTWAYLAASLMMEERKKWLK